MWNFVISWDIIWYYDQLKVMEAPVVVTLWNLLVSCIPLETWDFVESVFLDDRLQPLPSETRYRFMRIIAITQPDATLLAQELTLQQLKPTSQAWHVLVAARNGD